MAISVVIPTCNRKKRLLLLLGFLNQSIYPITEVIIVDSGEDLLKPTDYSPFNKLKIVYVLSEKSVCIQRNRGIQLAESEWIFLCDDDVEVPPDYLQKLVQHANLHPGTGAICGLFMQMENNTWTEQYPVLSSWDLVWRYVFQLGIWGEIRCMDNSITRPIKQYYKQKGNHISKAGWPVLTDFSEQFFRTPLYSLGAALVRKEWLLLSPFDEFLDSHGYGDNYGVTLGFPAEIHVTRNAFVLHHHEPSNRLPDAVQYSRRVLALDYFIRTKPALKHVSRIWFLWSLTGNLFYFLLKVNGPRVRASLDVMRQIIINRNPYMNRMKTTPPVEK